MNVAKSLSCSLLLSCILLCISCRSDEKRETIDYSKLSTITDNGFNMVVEIPAGSNHKIEYNRQSGKFENDKLNGLDRIVNFLPYPGNYGFVPGTLMDLARGGDGDPLDVLLIAESLPTGTIIEVKPIAALVLKDNDELDTKIIAVPADSSYQVLQLSNHRDFVIEYTAVQNIIEDWFLNYKGPGQVVLLEWKNDQYAWAEIRKWSLPNQNPN